MKINPNDLRKIVLNMVYTKKSGHIGGSFSIAELISLLYSEYDLANENRKNRLILSKAHAVPILYAVLNILGKITGEELKTFREINSRLQGHCDKNRLSLLDATAGSLGQGLSIAIGHSLGKLLKKETGDIFCVLGDGELNEGGIWESLMYYPKTKLTNLVCVVDWNKIQSEDYVKNIIPMYDNLEERISSFGWNCRTIDGHNIDAIKTELSLERTIPLCLILNTIKGKGVSFMENDVSWHSRIPTEEEYRKAMEELNI